MRRLAAVGFVFAKVSLSLSEVEAAPVSLALLVSQHQPDKRDVSEVRSPWSLPGLSKADGPSLTRSPICADTVVVPTTNSQNRSSSPHWVASSFTDPPLPEDAPGLSASLIAALCRCSVSSSCDARLPCSLEFPRRSRLVSERHLRPLPYRCFTMAHTGAASAPQGLPERQGSFVAHHTNAALLSAQEER